MTARFEQTGEIERLRKEKRIYVDDYHATLKSFGKRGEIITTLRAAVKGANAEIERLRRRLDAARSITENYRDMVEQERESRKKLAAEIERLREENERLKEQSSATIHELLFQKHRESDDRSVEDAIALAAVLLQQKAGELGYGLAKTLDRFLAKARSVKES